MFFLIWIIWNLQSAQTELALLVPGAALTIRSCITQTKLYLSFRFLLLGCIIFLMIICLQYLTTRILGADIQSVGHAAPIFVPQKFWFASRIACSTMIVLVTVFTFQKELSDPHWAPEMIRQIIYFGMRSFPVIRTFGEETRYTHAIIHSTQFHRSLKSRIQNAAGALFTFIERLCAYVNDISMLIEVRGGLPPMHLWKKKETSPRRIWLDLTFILIIESASYYLSIS